MIPIFLPWTALYKFKVESRDGVVGSPQFKITIARVNTSYTITL